MNEDTKRLIDIVDETAPNVPKEYVITSSASQPTDWLGVVAAASGPGRRYIPQQSQGKTQRERQAAKRERNREKRRMRNSYKRR